MAGLKLHTIYEAVVFVNGNTTLGQVEEFTVPGIKPKMVEFKGLAIQQAIEIPMGFEKTEFKAKWNSFYDDVLTIFANVYEEMSIVIFGNVQKWEGDSKIGEVPAVFTIRGKSKGTPDLGIKQQDNPELEKMVSVSSIKYEVDGQEIFELDPQNQIYTVEGVDMWAQRRANLGF